MVTFVKGLKLDDGTFIEEGRNVELKFEVTGEVFVGTLGKTAKKRLELILEDTSIRVFQVAEVDVQLVVEE